MPHHTNFEGAQFAVIVKELPFALQLVIRREISGGRGIAVGEPLHDNAAAVGPVNGGIGEGSVGIPGQVGADEITVGVDGRIRHHSIPMERQP